MSMDRRLGRFSISSRLIKTTPELALNILKDIIVVRAETMFHYDCVDYIGISRHFDVLEIGSMPPEYRANIEDNLVIWIKDE